MAFFEYDQNNSGGSFIVDHKVGHKVLIEANSSVSAEGKAEAIGVYFDGCADDIDCSCCGDRWSRQYVNGHDSLERAFSGVKRDDEMSGREYESGDFYWLVHQLWHVYFMNGDHKSYLVEMCEF